MVAELPTAQSQLHSRLASFAALSTEQAKGTRDCLGLPRLFICVNGTFYQGITKPFILDFTGVCFTQLLSIQLCSQYKKSKQVTSKNYLGKKWKNGKVLTNSC